MSTANRFTRLAAGCDASYDRTFDDPSPELISAIYLPHSCWQIRWRRQSWDRPKHQTYETENGARQFIGRKLLGGDRPHLAPIAFIELWRRPVGHWALHEKVLP